MKTGVFSVVRRLEDSIVDMYVGLRPSAEAGAMVRYAKDVIDALKNDYNICTSMSVHVDDSVETQRDGFVVRTNGVKIPSLHKLMSIEQIDVGVEKNGVDSYVHIYPKRTIWSDDGDDSLLAHSILRYLKRKGFRVKQPDQAQYEVSIEFSPQERSLAPQQLE